MRREWITVEDLSGAGITNAMLQGDAGAGTFGGRSGLWWRAKFGLEFLVRGNKGSARERMRVRLLEMPRLVRFRFFCRCHQVTTAFEMGLGSRMSSTTQG
jgi:hypothetical protein